MANFSIGRILSDEQRLKDWHLRRVQDLRLDRRLRDLDPTVSMQPDDKITAMVMKVLNNRPMVYWDWCVAALGSQQLKYRNPFSPLYHDQPEKADQKSANVEYLAYGIDTQLDAISSGRGDEPWRFKLAEQIVGGSYSLCPMVSKAEDGSLIFDIRFLDPMTVFWLPGMTGMQIVVESSYKSLMEARIFVEEHGGRLAKVTGDDTTKVKMVDYWVMDGGKVYNACVVSPQKDYTPEAITEGRHVDDSELGLDFTETKYDAIPIICGVVNARGEAGEGNPTQMYNYGRSILATLRREIQQANTWDTLAALSAKQAMFADVVDKTRGASGVVDKTDLQAGKQNIWHLEPEEVVEYLKRPTAPFDVQQQSTKFAQRIDEGSIPPQMFGVNSPQLASGFLENNLRVNATMRLARYEEVFKAVAKRAMMNMIRRFREFGGEVTLQGKHLERNGLDGYFQRDFKAEDLPKYWDLLIEHEPVRLTDEAALVNNEIAKYTAGTQSMRRTQESLGVQDPAGEQDRRELEEYESHPLIKARKVAARAFAELQDLRDKQKKLEANKASPDAIRIAKLNADVAERIYNDLEASLLGGGMQQSVPSMQGQPGQEAPQPNAPVGPSNPSPAVSPPQFRGQGSEQKRAAAQREPAQKGA